jgi:hypothetical protein
VGKFDKEFVAGRADYIIGRQTTGDLPVNLLPVARHQRVRRIELCPMIIEGCTKPVKGGFHIFVRNEFPAVIDPGRGGEVGSLKPRQRFTLAHEIVHTFFYSFDHDPPKVLRGAPKYDDIESLCNFGAGRLLVPERLIKLRLGPAGAITSNFVVRLGKECGVSSEVVIRRLNDSAAASDSRCALLLARREQSDEDRIHAYYFHPSLLPYLSKPKRFSTLREWSEVFNEVDEFLTEPMWDYALERGKGRLLFRKRPHTRRKNSFFLEVEFKHHS